VNKSVVEAPPHPAVYSDAVVVELQSQIDRFRLNGGLALDPFAGVGQKVDRLDLHVIKIELQHGWAKPAGYGMVQADSRSMPFADHTFDLIVTSPAYGNRMADKHNARDGSRRITYKHYLDRTGEELREGNAGGMQWGKDYQQLHQDVWAECRRVLRSGGMFLLNVSDHIRAGQRQYVSRWHADTLTDLGFTLAYARLVETPRMRRGQNGNARVQGELVMAFRKDR